MADIFISYTSSDRDWAFWIGQVLEELGHTPHVHEWEVAVGGNIAAYMEERHENADHILCVISKVYLSKPFSSLERRSAEWAAAIDRPNFVLPVFVEDCEPPTLLARFKRCDLFGVNEDEARARLAAYLAPAKRPSSFVRFPSLAKPAQAPTARPDEDLFPGARAALSNISIAIPLHFLGRDDALVAINATLKGDGSIAPIAALYGLPGVGKTTLAAAYAEGHRAEYRATWWVRAQTTDSIRADLAALGVRLGWVAANEKEEPALETVRERLRDDGEGLLLIFDNALDAERLERYLPTGGAAHVLVTSTAPTWRGIAAPVEVSVWPKQVGADYLIARTGRDTERREAAALSEALGGLPLAHEQAANYCERLAVSLSDYRKRFEAAPARLLDAARDASGGLSVAKSFALAIDEAAKLHPAAEPLIFYAALLAAEPIPLFLFCEGREKFGEPLASDLAGDGLDEAVAALRAFALVDRETIADERDPAISTETIRLHKLVRIAAASRRPGDAVEAGRRVLIEAVARVYPSEAYSDPSAWPRARRLDALAVDLVGGPEPPPAGAEAAAGFLLDRLAAYWQGALAAYAAARPLYERALAITEKALGPEHPNTARTLNNFGSLLYAQGDLAGARPLFERSLAIYERALGPAHPSTATSLDNLAFVLQAQGNLAGAQPLCERALAIKEAALGPEHPDTANSLNNLAGLLYAQGDVAGARPLFERALAIREKALGPEHPSTAASLNESARLLQAQGDLAGAQPLFERALAIYEKAFGPEHPDTIRVRDNLSTLRLAEGARSNR